MYFDYKSPFMQVVANPSGHDSKGFNVWDTSGLDMMQQRPPMMSAQTPQSATSLLDSVTQTPSTEEEFSWAKLLGSLGGGSKMQAQDMSGMGMPQNQLGSMMSMLKAMGGGQEPYQDFIQAQPSQFSLLRF